MHLNLALTLPLLLPFAFLPARATTPPPLLALPFGRSGLGRRATVGFPLIYLLPLVLTVSVEHVADVIERYRSHLILKDESSQRSCQPFVGSVARIPLLRDGDGLFQTFDTVDICNNQRMPAGRRMPHLRSAFLLSTWNDDGVPISFFHIPPDQVPSWEAQMGDAAPFYLHCHPNWFQERIPADPTSFTFSSSTLYLPVTYANLPYDQTAFPMALSHKRKAKLLKAPASWFSLSHSPP